MQSEKDDIKMQVCDTHTNEHTALKRKRPFYRPKKGVALFTGPISKVYRYRHQKTKLKIKFYLYLSDSCHQKNKSMSHGG